MELRQRADIGMRLVLNVGTYEQVGRIMDAIDLAVRNTLTAEGVDRAAFDYVSFNTHPCKALTVDRYASQIMPEQEAGMDVPPNGRELPLVVPTEG